MRSDPSATTIDSYPLAAFRIVLFSSLLLHFGPSMWTFHANYGEGAFRMSGWSNFLYNLTPQIRVPLAGVAVAISLISMLGGLVGYRLRASCGGAWVSLLTLNSINSFNSHTLALSQVWPILALGCILGGGDEALSVGRWHRRSARPLRPASRLQQSTATIFLLCSVLFAGIEKLLAGWPFSGSMARMLRYPEGAMLRDWTMGRVSGQTEFWGYLLESATLIIEIGVPLAFAVPRLRSAALLIYSVFFASILATLQVPLLFGGIFLGAVGMLRALPPGAPRPRRKS